MLQDGAAAGRCCCRTMLLQDDDAAARCYWSNLCSLAEPSNQLDKPFDQLDKPVEPLEKFTQSKWHRCGYLDQGCPGRSTCHRSGWLDLAWPSSTQPNDKPIDVACIARSAPTCLRCLSHASSLLPPRPMQLGNFCGEGI